MSDKYELCNNCPKKDLRQGWLARMFPKSYDSACNGPENVATSGEVDTDYEKHTVVATVVSTMVCDREVTPEMRARTSFIEQTIENSQRERQAELDRAWAQMSEEEKQAHLDAPISFEI